MAYSALLRLRDIQARAVSPPHLLYACTKGGCKEGGHVNQASGLIMVVMLVRTLKAMQALFGKTRLENRKHVNGSVHVRLCVCTCACMFSLPFVLKILTIFWFTCSELPEQTCGPAGVIVVVSTPTVAR